MTTDARRPDATRRALIIAAIAWTGAYLVWRAGWTMAGTAPWLSVPLFAVEVWALLRLVLLAVATWTSRTSDAPPTRAGASLTIELVVPAAHATAEQVGRTLVVAAADPADEVRVLDTRHRPDVAAETARHGARYEVVELPTGAAVDSTALVAAALVCSTHQLVAWVDAGDVLAPGMAEMAARFEDPRVAIVQAATHYANRDSLLHSRPDHDERAVDEQVIGPASGAAGAAPWNGSGSLIRTAALRSIGGLAGISTTDAAVRLAASGRRIEFSRRPVVRVTAPDTLDDYLAAVARRTDGPWRNLLSAESPVVRRGIRWRTRLAMIEAATRPVDGLVRLTLLSALALTIWTGRLPMTASVGGLVVWWLPAYVLRSRAQLAMARGTLIPGDLTRQSLRQMGVHLQVLAGRRPAAGSGVGRRERRRSAARTVRVVGRLPLVSAAAVVINLGIVGRALTFWFPTLLHPLSDTARAVVMAAAIVALVPIVDVLQVLLNRQQRRSSHRINTALIAEVDGVLCKAHDVTPTGLGFDLAEPPTMGERVPILLAVPRVTGEIDDLELIGEVMHVSDPRVGARLSRIGGTPLRRVGVRLVDVGPDGRDALVEICALTASERDQLRDRVAQHSPDALGVSTTPMWRRTLAALNVVGLLTAGLVVVGAPAGAEATADSGSSVIEGYVYGTDGVLPDICVTLTDVKVEPAVTRGDGFFSLEGLPAGDHVVMAYVCDGSGGYATTYHPDTTNASATTPVRVEDGEKIGIKIDLVPTGRVYGTVLDDDKKPLSGICVVFLPEGSDETEAPPADPKKDAATDENGRYAVDVPAGRATFRYTDCTGSARFSDTWYPGAPDRAASKDVEVVAHDKTEVEPVVMIARPQVSGRVTDEKDEPLENVCVSVQDVEEGSMTGLAFTTTDKEGRYSFAAPNGTHSLLFQDCGTDRGLVPVWYGGSPQFTNPAPTVDLQGDGQLEFDQRLVVGGSMAGTVRDPEGRAAAGVCIAVHPTELILEQADWTTAYWGPTDPDTGEWTSTPLPGGSYLLQFVNCDTSGYQAWGEWREEFFHHVFTGDDDSDLHDSKPIEIQPGMKPEPIDHTMTRMTGLTGRVTAEKTGVGQVCVGSTPGNGATRTADDGTWSMALPQGDYQLTFTDCQAGRGLAQTTSEASVLRDQITTSDVEMRQRPTATMLGTVATAKGLHLPNVCVVAYAPNDAPSFARVSDDGGWELPGLGAGRYWVAAINCDDPGRPMVDPERPKDEYPTTWFPAAEANLEQHAQPEKDGATAITLDEGSTVKGLDICLGGCDTGPTDTVPPTTAPPTTAPPTTAPPTTAPPTTTTIPATTVPTTTTIPATTVPPTTTPTTTVPPTTAAPTTTTTSLPARPTATTPAPTTSAPDDRLTNRSATRRSGAGEAGSGGSAPTTRPASTRDAEPAPETGASEVPATEDGRKGSTTTSTSNGRLGDDTSTIWNDPARVEGVWVDAARRIAGDTDVPTELASRATVASTTGAGHRSPAPWTAAAGLTLVLAACLGLLGIRRRSSRDA